MPTPVLCPFILSYLRRFVMTFAALLLRMITMCGAE
jgi:hypothetical protein